MIDPSNIKIHIPCGNIEPEPSAVKVFIASPYTGHDVLMGWEEAKGTDAFKQEVDAVGSALTVDYGLDEAPSKGLWVFEGTLSISASMATSRSATTVRRFG